MTNLTDNQTKYQVRVNGRVIGEAFSRTAAEVLIGQLTESERAGASIIPVASDGKQVLLG